MTIVAEWNPYEQDTPPDTSHAKRWQAAVRQTAEGLEAPHIDRERLMKAMDLCLAGKVTYQGSNTYTVQSGRKVFQSC
jgi:hypothetical protein